MAAGANRLIILRPAEDPPQAAAAKLKNHEGENWGLPQLPKARGNSRLVKSMNDRDTPLPTGGTSSRWIEEIGFGADLLALHGAVGGAASEGNNPTLFPDELNAEDSRCLQILARRFPRRTGIDPAAAPAPPRASAQEPTPLTQRHEPGD